MEYKKGLTTLSAILTILGVIVVIGIAYFLGKNQNSNNETSTGLEDNISIIETQGSQTSTNTKNISSNSAANFENNLNTDQCKVSSLPASIFSPNKIYSLVNMSCVHTSEQIDQFCSLPVNQYECLYDGDYRQLVLVNEKGEKVFDWTFDFNYSYKNSNGEPLVFIDDNNILLSKNNSFTNGQLILNQFNISDKKVSTLYTYENLGKQIFGLNIVSQDSKSIVVEPQGDNGYLPQRVSIDRVTKVIKLLPVYTLNDAGYWSSYTIWGYSYKQPKIYFGPSTSNPGNGVWVHKIGNGGFEMRRVSEAGIKNSFMVPTLISQPNCFESFGTDSYLVGYHFKSSCSDNWKSSQDVYIFKTVGKDFPYLEVVTDTSQIPEATLMVKSLKVE